MSEPWALATELADQPDWIQTTVGNELRIVPFDEFIEVYDSLSAELQALGLVAPELDHRLMALLPARLEQVLGRPN
jgi:hypothetical protein